LSGFVIVSIAILIQTTIIKAACDRIRAILDSQDPLLDIACALENAPQNDNYFKQQHDKPQSRILRPRQIYTGKVKRRLSGL